MTDHHVIHIFYILLPLTSKASSGFHPIFTIDSMQKMSIGLKAKYFLLEVKRVSYSLASYFLKLGIWLWIECVCLCILNISLLLLTCFCSWVLQLIAQVLNVLMVSLCKPVMHKLKILVGGKLEYYKSIGGTGKRGRESNFEISVGGCKKGWTRFFDSNLVGQKSWRKPWSHMYERLSLGLFMISLNEFFQILIYAFSIAESCNPQYWKPSINWPLRIVLFLLYSYHSGCRL